MMLLQWGMLSGKTHLFYLFIFYLKFIYSWLLTKKKYLAYLKTMLIYVKKTIKNINIS